MSKSATQTAQPAAKSLSLVQGILQRKCVSCGNHTVAGGECAECGKNKATLQRKANNQNAPSAGFSLPGIPVMQRKLIIGASNDPLEQEADRIADQVLSAPLNSAVSGAPPRIQRYAGQAVVGAEIAPVSVDRVLASSGRSLGPALRQDMEQRFGHDFSQVRVHTGAAAEQSAREVNAHAYTVGQNVAFAAGQYAPASSSGKRLLAHELAHVVQQSGSGTSVGLSCAASEMEMQDDNAAKETVSSEAQDILALRPLSKSTGISLARKADPAAVAKMKTSEIQANPDYIDNNFKSMSFYGAEEADITYTDGAVLRIGLVPQWVKAPFVTVDYHNARSEFASWNKSDQDLRFVPQNKIASATPGLTFGEALEKFSVPVTFAVESASGKIVPNHVNPVTAPKLCAWLLATEAEYIKNFDDVAKGMIVILEKMKLIIELRSLLSPLPKGTGAAKVVPKLRPPIAGAAVTAFDAAAVAEELVVATKSLPNVGAKMLQAATRLSGMGGLSAAEKVKVILEFFKRIGFGIGKEGVTETGEFFLMKSEDAKYAFRIIKATGEIWYGKFDLTKIDYVWSLLK